MFTNYSFERVGVTEINELYTDPLVLARNPFLRDSLLIGQGGERIISKVAPSIVYNTVDQPIFPTTGKRYSASIDLAGLGGNTNFYRPMVEGVWYFRQASRLTLGMRAQADYIHQFTGSKDLPIFEKLFLGGEYNIRGFDIRTIGPQDPQTGLVLGGNKLLLFNVEEQFTIAGPVRVIAFFDAGQIRDIGQPFGWKENIVEVIPPLLSDPLASVSLTGPGATIGRLDTRIIGQRAAFKTSTGLEVRFFMPVLNVPFRLLFPYNPSRGGGASSHEAKLRACRVARCRDERRRRVRPDPGRSTAAACATRSRTSGAAGAGAGGPGRRAAAGSVPGGREDGLHQSAAHLPGVG